MKIKLLFPPFWICNSPYLSIPSLVAYLETKGINVQQMDLNLRFYDQLLSKEFIEYCIKEYNYSNETIQNESYFSSLNEVAEFVAQNIDEAKNVFRSKKSLDLSVYTECRDLMAVAFSIINIAFRNEKIDFHFYESEYDRKSFKEILQCAKDFYNGNNNSMLSWLLEKNIDDVLEDTDLIGISLTGLDQIIPSFALAGIIKKRRPDIKIVIGGSIPTRWFSIKPYSPDIFEYIDYVILNEGEVSLTALIKSLKDKSSLSVVPNLVYKNSYGEIVYTKDQQNSKPNIFPTPVFNICDIKKYFSPVPFCHY